MPARTSAFPISTQRSKLSYCRIKIKASISTHSGWARRTRLTVMTEPAANDRYRKSWAMLVVRPPHIAIPSDPWLSSTRLSSALPVKEDRGADDNGSREVSDQAPGDRSSSFLERELDEDSAAAPEHGGAETVEEAQEKTPPVNLPSVGAGLCPLRRAVSLFLQQDEERARYGQNHGKGLQDGESIVQQRDGENYGCYGIEICHRVGAVGTEILYSPVGPGASDGEM